MRPLQIEKAPEAKTGMLIRRPVAEVFEAFVDPNITRAFWFTEGSGRLTPGADVTWKWEMYGADARVTTKVVEPNRRIVIEWDGYSGRTTVEWKFASLEEGATFVSITESGWTGNGDELVKYVGEAAAAFTWILAGCKAFLEHGLRLNVVADRFPRGPGEPYPDG